MNTEKCTFSDNSFVLLSKRQRRPRVKFLLLIIISLFILACFPPYESLCELFVELIINAHTLNEIYSHNFKITNGKNEHFYIKKKIHINVHLMGWDED